MPWITVRWVLSATECRRHRSGVEEHMKVWILVVEHHNGRDLYPCASYDRAWEKLELACLQEFWHSSGGHIPPDPPTPGDPTSMTAEERIETFSSIGRTSGTNSMRSRNITCSQRRGRSFASVW